VKGPLDIGQGAELLSAAATLTAEERVRPKLLLRQEQFLARRALIPGPGELAVEANEGRSGAPAAGASPYLLGMRAKGALLAERPPEPAVVWRPLGPAGIPRGQTYGSGTTTVAGRVPAIAVDPGDSAHILVGTAAGGVWQTRDGGATWTPQTDDQPTLSIGALAFDPRDPSTVYAGTGEANSEYGHLGQGILVSHDGGSTWAVVAQELFAGFGFYRLVVDPRDGLLLGATNGGAVVSPDGGQTWSLLHEGLTWDLSLAHRDDEPEILLAAPDGLFAGVGGAALAKVHVPGLPALDAQMERMAVAHAPADPGQAFAFAASGGKAHLWQRAAADGPWEEVELPSFGLGDYVEDVLDVAQAMYDWYVAVPPGGADVVYLGAIELLRGERSADGWNWSDVSTRIEQGDSIHPDQHTMAFDAQQPGVLYAGSDGGIFRSPDGGDSWESLNAGLAISEVEYMTQRPDEPVWMLAGLQDNGTVRREPDESWSQVGLGDGGDCGTDMEAPDVCFHSYYQMTLERSSRRGDADSWERIFPRQFRQIPSLFYPPVEVNGDVVVKAGETVCLSSDRGDSWSTVELPRAGNRRSIPSALAIPTPERALVGTVWGDVFRIDREQGDWGAVTKLARPQDGWISDLMVDPRAPERCWATFSSPGSVLRSDDGGATWTDVTSNLPRIPVNAIVNDPADVDRVWVACDVGVFESRDAGRTWAVFGTGLPNALAEDLVFHERERLLRVGTRSRGVWEAAVG
jgi:photosystem II stability/assembly factor-like uncharacterized protein